MEQENRYTYYYQSCFFPRNTYHVAPEYITILQSLIFNYIFYKGKIQVMPNSENAFSYYS